MQSQAEENVMEMPQFSAEEAEAAGVTEQEAEPLRSSPDTVAAQIKVTVIMPIYNAYDYLRPAIDSVLDQTLRDIELICVDDGSTDHSLEILKEYQSGDSRLRIVTENNAGPAKARNNGLRRARGEFVAFLDADDFYEPTLLQTLYDLATQNALDIAICSYDLYLDRKSRFERRILPARIDLFVPDRVTSKNEHPDHIFQMTEGYVWNKLFRTSFVREKNLCFPEQVRFFEDVYFTFTALSLAERIARTDGVLLHHRVYPEQGRTRMFRKYYGQMPAMYGALKEFLMHHGMYLPLRESFVNVSATRCYNAYNMLWMDGKRKFYDMLHDGYAEQLGWADIPAEAYHDADVCEFTVTVQIYDHSMYLKRLTRDIRLGVGKIKIWLDRQRKNKSKQQNEGNFFTALLGIFKRKKKPPKA